MRFRNANTFRSLRIRNYRLYFGQLVSLAGTFMQTIAQSWLVLKLTDSGTALGIVNALQFAPILLLGGQAGVLVDRIDRRRLYMWTQCLGGVEALGLGVLTMTGTVELWMVYVLAAVLGGITALDQTVRSALVFDLVGPSDLTNAVSLNMATAQTSRVVGPALAGVTIATLGVGPCFLINAVSFAAVIVALVLIRPDEMHTAALQPRVARQFREGLAYVRKTPDLLALLVAAALAFAFAWEFDVVVPLMAKATFHGGAGIYAVLTSALGAGAVAGALIVATAKPSATLISRSGIAYGAAMVFAAFAPTLPLEMAAMALSGGAGVAFAALISSHIQLRSDPAMRGRMVALWSVAAVGSRPLGSLIVGYVGQHLGPRAALGLGAVVVLIFTLPGPIVLPRLMTPAT